VIGVAPLQTPSEAVSVEPTCVVPEIVGGVVLTGGDACSAARPLRALPKTDPIRIVRDGE